MASRSYSTDDVKALNQFKITLLRPSFRTLAPFFVIVFCNTLLAAPDDLLQTIPNPVPSDNSSFGGAIAQHGDRLLVGCAEDDTSASNSGRAYLFDSDGSILFTFENPTPASFDKFGACVAVHNDLLIIGAPNDDQVATDGGVIHIFDGITGNFSRTIPSPSTAISDQFGSSIISLGGNRIAVGAPFHSISNSQDGRVYIIDLATDSVARVIENPTPDGSDRFGHALHMIDDDLLVGAPFERSGVSTILSGALYRINPTNGSIKLKIQNPLADSHLDRFAWALSAAGTKIFAGAPGDDEIGLDAGQVYVFEGTTGQLLQILSPPNGSQLCNFGTSVASFGAFALIGCPRQSVGLTFPGRVYAMSVTTGNLFAEFASPNSEDFGFFGSTVLASEGNVIIAAPTETVGGFFAGRIYRFEGTPLSPASHWQLYP